MRFASVRVVALVVFGLVACSSSVTPSDGPGAGTTPGPDGGNADGGTGAAEAGADAIPGFPDDRGPGIYGALPSGYCCTKDAECRGRHCADAGAGGKMCLDQCFDPSDCDVPRTAFECKALAGETIKRCSPPAGAQCIPQGDFVRGKKATGACCAFGAGQAAGADCASHLCGNFDKGPYLCLSHCTGQADCPSDYKCQLDGAPGWVPTCFPLAVFSGDAYTCK